MRKLENELLAIVFAMEKFETCLYGRKVLVETDHKPLKASFKKSLLNAPKRLKRKLLWLQHYEFDPLSRAYLSLKEATEKTS